MGDEGEWFSNDYANGIDGTFAVPGEVCAISGDYLIENDDGPEPSVRAWHMRTTGQVWEIEDAQCGKDAGTPEGVIISNADRRSNNWRVIDYTTGEITRNLAPLDNDPLVVQYVASVDNTLVVSTSEDGLHGIGRDGEPEWSVNLGPETYFHQVWDRHIGLTQRLTDRVRIINASTGEETYSDRVSSRHDVTWAADGFVLKINESDPEYAYYDVNGEEVDRTVGESQYGFLPAPRHGITFPIEDHVNAGTVVAVNTSGEPVLFESEGVAHTREGRIDAGVLDFSGVSGDGSHLLMRNQDDLTLVNEEGETIWTHPATSDVMVQSSWIVISDRHSTQVLIPASG